MEISENKLIELVVNPIKSDVKNLSNKFDSLCIDVKGMDKNTNERIDDINNWKNKIKGASVAVIVIWTIITFIVPITISLLI